MRYLYAYLSAVWAFFQFFGSFFLISHILCGPPEFWAVYFTYTSLVAGVAGPISLIMIQERE